jgi:hypothetical protein
VRKLRAARILSVLLALALGVVVVDERRQQERESDQLQRISGPFARGYVIDLQVDGTGRPRARPGAQLRETGR